MSDPILLWNEVALEANRVSHTNGQGEQTGPPLSARALAIVHLATYDAYAGVINDPNTLPRYLPTPPPPSAGASPDEAVAAAAEGTLSALFPSQTPFFDAVFAGVGDPTRSGPAHVFGAAVAAAILQDRAGDPGAGGPYAPSPARGKHRPDPDNPGQGFHAPVYGAQSEGFGIEFRHELAAPPPTLNNNDYLRALRQVRGVGCAPELSGNLPSNLARRTPDQTVIGLYWGYDGAAEIGTPPRLYNQIIRRVARAKQNTVAQNARLFAFVNVAMADAAILAWDQKYIHNFWRPVLGIREHDRSMGPQPATATSDLSDDCDAQWLPLGAPNTNRSAKNFTPPFPAYPSGHATFGAAAFHITRLFYNQGGTFKNNNLSADSLFNGLDYVSDELNGISTDNHGTVRPRHRRDFAGGLWQMIEENGRSRVYLGVHWVFDAFAVNNNNQPDLSKKVGGKFIGGVPLGLLIAEDVFTFGGGKAPKKSTVGPRQQAAVAFEGTATYSSTYMPEAQAR
jgi:vanadium chloroperoxidase